MSEKEIFEFWKTIYPVTAYGNGITSCAGTLWTPTHENTKNALITIKKLEKTPREDIKKFLHAIRRDIITEEPHIPPGEILNAYYTHLIKKAPEKHYITLSQAAIHHLKSQQHTLSKKWPIEFQIYTIEECKSSSNLLNIIKKKCKKKETRKALNAVQTQLKKWQQHITRLHLTQTTFETIYPILKRSSTNLNRKHIYVPSLKDYYDYHETPTQIETLALRWLNLELPIFKRIVQKLSTRYHCEPTVENIENALNKHQGIPLKKLLQTVQEIRTTLKPLAEQEWVAITPTYNTTVIETPPYLTPFIPTAAMQTFDTLTKPFCISFITTNPNASPSTNLPDLVQTIIHEEYGHCVNFLNSYTNKKTPLRNKLDSTLDTPITEGISFNRESEALTTFQHIHHSGPKNNAEKKFVQTIEQYAPFGDFVDGITFIVHQWRIIRFLRAISDVRINLHEQTFPTFIEWAHKYTGLSKKLIFDQTFHFQERPGYAPCYSIFGQQLKKYQQQALSKGISQKTFNTYVASIGFPPRSTLERMIRHKFNL